MFKITPLKRVLYSRTMAASMVGVFSVISILLSIFVFSPGTATAANATNNTLNFQARLESNTGSIVPDGNYNVEFKLYDGDTSGGTAGKGAGFAGNLLWTETRQNSNSQGVTVKNGYLSVSLGSVNPFPSTINWDQGLWVTMNIGGTTTGTSITWDGEMNPRLKLTGVPYAFRAGQLAAYNSTSDLTSTLSILQPTVGNQTFQIADQAATGTFTLCVQGAVTANGGCAPTTGGSGYVQNQNAGAQTTANFWISGTGRADGGFVGPSLDAASGTLSVGASTASTVNIATNAAAHTIAIGNGAAVQGITIGSTNGASSLLLQAGSGNLALLSNAGGVNIGSVGTSTAGSTVNISNTSNGTGIQGVFIGSNANASSNVTIDAGNTGKIQIGNSTTAHTIQIGAGGTAAQSVALGSLSSSSTTTIQGGSGNINLITNQTGAGVKVQTLTNNSTTALLVQDSGNNSVLTVDTVNLNVGIGIAGATSDARLFAYVGGGTNTVFRGNTVGSGDLLQLQQSGTNVLNVTSTGATLLKNSSNSTAALQIQNTAGGSLFTADTQNTRVGIGSNIPLNTFSVSPVDITGTASATTGGVVTATAGTFTSAMVGEQLVFANGVSGTIITYTSGTQVTISPSPASAVSSQSFSVYKIGLQVSAGGNVAAGVNAFNGKLTVGGEIALQESSAPSATSGYGKVYASSSDHSLHYVNNTGVDTALGGGGGASNLQGAYNGSGATSPQIVLNSSYGGLVIADGATAVTGNLFAVKNNAASVTYLGVTSTQFTLQNSSGNNGLLFDTTNTLSSNHLKVYENVASSPRYADIYYDNTNGEAVYSSSSGNTRIGNGSGNVTINLTNVPDVLAFTKTGTLSGAYTSDDFTIRRTLTGGANNIQGNVLRVEDTSSVSTGALQSTILYVNENNLSATGNLIAAAKNGVNKFTVDGSGTATATTFSGTTGNITTVNATTFSGPTYTGSGAVTVSSGGTNTTLTLQSAGTGDVVLKPGTDNATGILLANAAGTAILTVDTTTSGASGGKIVIGSATTDTTTALLQLDSNSNYTSEPTCSTTNNQGGLYYNTASNSIRGCVGGNWEDLPSTAGLGIFLFGVVPDSGNNPGDLPALTTTGVTGPCKVSWASATSVTVAPCTAYSGGRKVIVPSTTLPTSGATGVSTTNIWAHICLNGTASQPAFTAANSAEVNSTNLPSFSINNPIECIADIKFSAATSGNIAQIYDTRTFINTQKEFVTMSTAATVGMIVCASGANAAPCTTASNTATLGVVVATSGATSTTAPAAIISTNGPTYVKATGGTAANWVVSSTTSGYASTTATAAYTMNGVNRTSWSSTCTSASTCLGSLYVNFHGR